MGNIGDFIHDVGGAAASLFNSQGNAAEANSYTSAAQLEQQNAQLTAASTRIQQAQTARTLSLSLGTTQADVAGAGFTTSGSALDVLRSSAQQGSLAKSLVNIQGAINENAYAAEAGVDFAKAKAANEVSAAGKVSAIASIGGALINGSQELASAGKTVAQGYNYVTHLFSGGSPSEAQLTDFATQDMIEEDAFMSGTDTSLSLGADLASTDIGIDTSSIALGTSEDIASSSISDAIAGGFSSVSSFAAPIGIGAAIGGIVGGKTGSIIGGIGGAVLAAAFSVICSALYVRELVSRDVWVGATRYGLALHPRTFAGYLFWATPVARRIYQSERFACFAAWVLRPAVHEMAFIMGQKNVKRNLYGFITHRVLLSLSWALGRLIKGDSHVEARA